MSDVLSGSIQPKDAMVLVLDRRDTTQKGQDTPVVLPLRLKADLFLSKDYNTSYSMSFNGDDAVSIDKYNDATAKWVPVDIFGKIGERPSPAWSDKPPYTGTGTWYSMDKTLIRKDSVMSGVAKNPLEFNPKVEWVLNPRDMFDSLGFHRCLCTQGPSVSVQAPVISQVAIYPNPAVSMATVFLPFEMEKLVCLNAAGQLVKVKFTILVWTICRSTVWTWRIFQPVCIPWNSSHRTVRRPLPDWLNNASQFPFCCWVVLVLDGASPSNSEGPGDGCHKR